MPDISLITYSGSLVTPQHDALLNDAELTGNGYLFGCEVTVADSTKLHITHGIAVVYGREIEIQEGDIPIQLAPSGTLPGRLYVHIDLNNNSSPVQLIAERGDSLSPLVDNPVINSVSGATDFLLATFTVSTSDITNLVLAAGSVTPTRSSLAALQNRIAALEADTGTKAVGSYISYRKKGNMVWVRVRQTGGDSRSPGYQFGQLPAGYRPTYGQIAANAYGTGWIWISQDTGMIEFSANGSQTANYIGACFCYPV